MNRSLIVAFGLCLLVVAYSKTDGQRKQTDEPGSIKVNRIELVNGQGDVVGILGTSNGQPAIHLKSIDGSTSCLIKPGIVSVTDGKNKGIVSGHTMGVVRGESRSMMTIKDGNSMMMTSQPGKTWSSATK